MNARAWLLRVPVLLLGFGCSVQPVDTASGGGDADRGPLGKADKIGSCEAPDGGDHCGGASYGNCYCDDQCEAFGDCCSDKPAVCDGSGDDGDDSGGSDGGADDPLQCLIECSVNCGQAFGCGCEELCGIEPEPPEFCVSDDDCGEGDSCNTDICVGSCPLCQDCNHVCMPDIEPEPEPEPDPALVCMLQCQATCAEISGDCGCAEQCGVEPPPPPTFCAGDEHCPGEQVCDTSLCVPSCPLCADCNFACVDP